VLGLQEMDRALREMPKDLAKGALRNAVNAGAVVLRNAARNAAPVRSDGKLKLLRPRLTRAAQKRIARRLGRSTTGSVQLTRAEIRQLAPEGVESGPTRAPGYLKKQIRVLGARLSRDGRMTARVTIGSAFYGGFREHGTKRQPARPWFKAAVEAASQQAVTAMGNRLKVEVERAARKWRARGR